MYWDYCDKVELNGYNNSYMCSRTRKEIVLAKIGRAFNDGLESESEEDQDVEVILSSESSSDTELPFKKKF